MTRTMRWPGDDPAMTDTGSTQPVPVLQEAIGACKRVFLAVVLFSLAINLLMLTAPLYMLQVFDRVLTSRSTDTLIFLTVIAGFALVTMAVLEAVRSRVMVGLATWLDGRVSGTVLTGNIVAALRRGTDPSVQGLRDMATCRTFLAGPSMFPILDAPWTPIFIAVIFLLHPVIGWLAVAGALVLIGLAIANEVTSRKPLQMAGAASIRSLQQAEAAVRNADVIEAMGMLPSLVRRWHRQNGEMLAYQTRASNWSGAITALSRLVRMVLQIGVLGLGSWLVLQDQMTAGAMIAGSILMSRALAPVEQAIGSWRSASGARSAYRRIKSLIEETPVRGTTMPLPKPEGRVCVDGVTFFYRGSNEPTLRNVGFRLERGESLGLIGPTAAGKSSLARLLVGNLQPRSGTVRLDSMDIAVWDPDDRGRHIGYLPQDVELFGGTVRDNIARMGDGEPEAVIAAARLAGVHELILELPAGYDTEIGVGGAVLSGGQRQRIALARAVYGDPSLVVLDEPNASLDGPGEAALIETMETLKSRGVTVIVIVHRQSILRCVDKVLALRNGAVQAFGPADEIVPTVVSSPQVPAEPVAQVQPST